MIVVVAILVHSGILYAFQPLKESRLGEEPHTISKNSAKQTDMRAKKSTSCVSLLPMFWRMLRKKVKRNKKNRQVGNDKLMYAATVFWGKE